MAGMDGKLALGVWERTCPNTSTRSIGPTRQLRLRGAFAAEIIGPLSSTTPLNEDVMQKWPVAPDWAPHVEGIDGSSGYAPHVKEHPKWVKTPERVNPAQIRTSGGKHWCTLHSKRGPTSDARQGGLAFTWPLHFIAMTTRFPWRSEISHPRARSLNPEPCWRPAFWCSWYGDLSLFTVWWHGQRTADTDSSSLGVWTFNNGVQRRWTRNNNGSTMSSGL